MVGVLLGLAVLVIAGIWYLNKPPAPPPVAPLTPEARAYVRNLKLSDVDMKAHESYMGQSVTEITGTVGNGGDRFLKGVFINCVFYDPWGQLVLRERVPIVSQKMGGLKPGETRPFRLAFDNVPSSWNQALPQMVIAAIDF
jgi:hypothetical protein